MTITRYEAQSVTQLGVGTGLTLVGGASCLTDETDLSTYADWNLSQGSGSPVLNVSFGTIPAIVDEDTRLVLHIVGTSVTNGVGTAPSTTSFARLVPVWIVDADGTQISSASGGFPSLTGLEPGEVVPCTQPYLPREAFSFNRNGEIVVRSNALSFGGVGGYYSFRLYGIYLTVQEGLTPGEPLDGVPYVSFNMYNGGLVTLNSDAEPLMSSGNSSSNGNPALAAWADGSVILPTPYLDTVPFAVLQPQGKEIYSLAEPTGDNVAAYDAGSAGSGDLSVVPLSSSGTVMAVWVRSDGQPVFWEFNRQGALLNEWLPSIPPHSTTGFLYDNTFPQTGGRFGDKFIFNSAGSGTSTGRTAFTYGSGNHGGDVLSMDLVTGQISVIITDEQIGLLAGMPSNDLNNPGSPFLGAICVDPDDGDIFMYLRDSTYDLTESLQEWRNDAQIWISRWGIDGTFKGKLGFNDDHVGVPYEWNAYNSGPGGITCCEDGRLIYFYAGDGPVIAGYGSDEYDGLLQLNKIAVPTDGSTAYAVPTPFWRSPDGTLEAIGGDVTKMMITTGTGKYLDTRVRFVG